MLGPHVPRQTVLAQELLVADLTRGRFLDVVHPQVRVEGRPGIEPLAALRALKVPNLLVRILMTLEVLLPDKLLATGQTTQRFFLVVDELDVLGEACLPAERGAALLAVEAALAGVVEHVRPKLTGLDKGLVADRTLVRFFPRVGFAMSVQGLPSREGGRALIATVGPFPSMTSSMFPKCSGGREGLGAQITRERFLSGMCTDVNVQQR